MKVLIIGGSRFVGPYVVRELAKRHSVTVYNRGTVSTSYPEGVVHIQGDRNEGFSEIQESFDAVVDMCAYTKEQIALAVTKLSYKYFLNFGTVAAYKHSEIFPITEEYPIGIYESWGEYNKGKFECEEYLRSTNIRFGTIRPTYILGPANYCDREHFIYRKLHAEEEIVLPGNGQAVVQFTFAVDVAKTIVKMVEENIVGEFNVSGDDSITLLGLVQMMADIAGKHAHVTYNPKADGANQIEAEFPFSNENMIYSNEKLKTLGIVPIPLYEGLKKDYEEYYSKQV